MGKGIVLYGGRHYPSVFFYLTPYKMLRFQHFYGKISSSINGGYNMERDFEWFLENYED